MDSLVAVAQRWPISRPGRGGIAFGSGSNDLALLHRPPVAHHERLAGEGGRFEGGEEEGGFGGVPQGSELAVDGLFQRDRAERLRALACSGTCRSTRGVRTKPGQITLARSPGGWPQIPTYQWWRRHDEYDDL